MYRWCRCALACTLVALSACQPDKQAAIAWPESRPLGSGLETFTAPDKPDKTTDTAAPLAVTPTGELTLRDALAAALMGNPELSRFSYETRAAEARLVQAGKWQNPEVGFEIENFAGSGGFDGTDAAEYTIVLSQTFPLGGDIKQRHKLEALRGQLIGWDYESARIALLAEVTRRYVQVLTAQRQIELARESLRLTEQVATTIDQRVEAGSAPAVERSRSALPVVLAKIALQRAERSLTSARVRLAQTWGEASPAFEAAMGDLELLHDVPDAEQLAALINQNPEAARWAAEIASRQAEVELARAEAVPDLTASLGYRWFNDPDDHALVAGVSVELPIFNNRQAEVLAARFGVAAAQNQRRAVELKLAAALSTIYADLVSAHDEAASLRELALPTANEAYEAISQAFDQGNLGYLDVLDAERTLIDLRQQYLDALTEYHSAVAEIEGLIGQSLDTAAAQPTPATDAHTATQEKAKE